jgi:hypothetical protein
MKDLVASRRPLAEALIAHLPARSGEGREQAHGVIVVAPCGNATQVASDWTKYTEHFAGTPTSAEIESAVQAAYAQAVLDASKHTPQPGDWRQCADPCFPQYAIVFGEIDRAVSSTVSGSASAGVGGEHGAASASGSLDVEGTLIGTVTVQVPWSVLRACVREGSESEEPGGGGASHEESGHTVTFGGGTQIPVECNDHFNNGRETKTIRIVSRNPIDIENNAGNWELIDVQPAVREVIRQAADRSTEALKDLPPCGPPCAKEQVSSTIGPIDVQYGYVGTYLAWHRYDVTISVDWYVRRRCA